MDEKIRIELLKIFYNRHKVVNELGWKAIVDSGYDTIIEDIVEKFDLIPRVVNCDHPRDEDPKDKMYKDALNKWNKLKNQ